MAAEHEEITWPSRPYASACMLSFNRPAFLETAIRTAVDNARYPLEMIVHDDGSSEETVATLLTLRRQGYISHLILNPEGHNEGQGVAMNRMAAIASGDPIIKMDHDLVLHPHWLRKVMETLEINHRARRQPKIGALGLFPYFHEPVAYDKMLIKRWKGWEEHKDFVGSAMVMPREAWEIFGPWSEHSEAFAEDYEYKMKVAESADWCNALTQPVLADNIGFGLGKSTVVVSGSEGLTAAEIKKGPMVIGSPPRRSEGEAA